MTTEVNAGKAAAHGLFDLKSLAELIYGVPIKSFRDDIQPIRAKLDELATKKRYWSPRKKKNVVGKRRWLNAKQLKLIHEHCGSPVNWTFNGKKFIKDVD